MARKISIPLSYLFFPITLPIYVVRITLAVLLGLLGGPYWWPKWATHDLHLARNFSISNTKTMQKGSNIFRNGIHMVTLYTVIEGEQRPSFLWRLAGITKPKTFTIWKSQDTDGDTFYGDGTKVSSDTWREVDKAMERYNEELKRPKRMLIIKYATDVK